MQMREDLQIISKLENGKAYLEFVLPEGMEEMLSVLRIEIREADGRLNFHGEYDSGDLEPMTALLLRPHLWNSIRDPYVYRVTACGTFRESAGNGERIEEVFWQQDLAIYDVRVIENKGFFLNEKEFRIHEAAYRLPPQISVAGTQTEQMEKDLERLARMGVNAICLEEAGSGPEIRSFYRMCQRWGFLTGDLWITSENIPVYRGLSGDDPREALLSADGRTLTERYYYYQAKWSSEPVLHPALSTLQRQENGLVSLTIYSNQKKVVLYVEGVLFLFQTSQSAQAGPEYLFEDIPVAKLPLHLAVEAGNLSISLTISKI